MRDCNLRGAVCALQVVARLVARRRETGSFLGLETCLELGSSCCGSRSGSLWREQAQQIKFLLQQATEGVFIKAIGRL